MKAPRNKAHSHKKPCSQGMQCPYRNEYQHQMEFSHDYIPSSSTNVGRGTSSVPTFAGGGHRLGAGTGSSSGNEVYRGLDHAQDEWLRSLQFESNISGRSTSSFVPDSLEDKFCCELCNEIIPLSAFDAHLQQHTRQQKGQESSNLRKEQDREYEQSVRLEQEKERQRVKAEAEAKRLERLKQAGEKRRRQREQELEEEIQRQRQAAKENLLPEPNASSYSGKALTLRFILPSGIRLTRRFRTESVTQDVRDYLLTIDELFGQAYLLRSPGQEDIRMDRQFVIKENTAFVVMIQPASAPSSESATVSANVIEVQDGGGSGGVGSDSPAAKRQKQKQQESKQIVSSSSSSSSSKYAIVDLT